MAVGGSAPQGLIGLKDVKLHFHQAKGQTEKLLIQCNWSGPLPFCFCIIGLKSAVMWITMFRQFDCSLLLKFLKS